MPHNTPDPAIDTSADTRDYSTAALDKLLTVDEVAALLKVSRSWVYEHTRARGLAHSERLPHVKLGKYVRFDPRAVRHFLSQRISLR